MSMKELVVSKKAWMWALLLVGVACASNQQVAENVANKIIDNCYQADEILVTESGSGGVEVGEGGTKVEIKGGHTAYIKGLKPAPKNKDETPEEPQQQPDSGGNLLAINDDSRPRDLAPFNQLTESATSTTVNRLPAPLPSAPPLRPAVAIAVDPT